METSYSIRAAEGRDLDALAHIWHDGWQEAHAAILPPELARHRTFASFRDRLAEALPNTRVEGPPRNPVGFCIVKDDEIYQMYVSSAGRGTGMAARLLADGEARIAARGVGTAWLACAIGNDRAARFYEKTGWQRIGNYISNLVTLDGTFPLEVWRYEKQVSTR